LFLEYDRMGGAQFPDKPNVGEAQLLQPSTAVLQPPMAFLTRHLPCICAAIGKTQVTPKVHCMYRFVCVCTEFKAGLLGEDPVDNYDSGQLQNAINELWVHRETLPDHPDKWTERFEATKFLDVWILASVNTRNPAKSYTSWTMPSDGAFCSYLLLPKLLFVLHIYSLFAYLAFHSCMFSLLIFKHTV